MYIAYSSIVRYMTCTSSCTVYIQVLRQVSCAEYHSFHTQAPYHIVSIHSQYVEYLSPGPCDCADDVRSGLRIAVLQTLHICACAGHYGFLAQRNLLYTMHQRKDIEHLNPDPSDCADNIRSRLRIAVFRKFHIGACAANHNFLAQRTM